MSQFISKLAPSIESMLDYREAFGYSRKTYLGTFLNIDQFFANNYPNTETLTSDAVTEWMNKQKTSHREKATALRNLANYLISTGKDAYVIPKNFIGKRNTAVFKPYLFSDDELSLLFKAADKFQAKKGQPFLTEIIPVMFRLIYTCGLRPNEGRELKYSNVNFLSGEILITNTKRKKERMVVMSDDMLALAKDYDEKRTIFAGDSQYLFPAYNGGSFTNVQIADYLLDCWKFVHHTEKLPNIRIYDFRHRFASAVIIKWLSHSENLMVKLPFLQAYMGHDNISETLYYVHLLPENLIKSSGIDWSAFDAIVPRFSEDESRPFNSKAVTL